MFVSGVVFPGDFNYPALPTAAPTRSMFSRDALAKCDTTMPLNSCDWHDDEEDWSETDDAFDTSAVIPCPECGAELYDDADHCHRCGHWLTDADRHAASAGLFDSRGMKAIAICLLVMFLVSLLLFGSIF